MFCTSFRQPLSTVIISILLLSASCNAAITPHSRSQIVRRQDDTGVRTFTTTEKISTEAGVFTQNCNIVITPITGANGEPLYRQEKSCSLSLDQESDPYNGEPPVPSGGSESSTFLTTLTSSSSTGGTSPSPTSTPPAGVSTGGVSSVSDPYATPNPSSTPSDNPTSTPVTFTPVDSTLATPTPTATESTVPPASAAAESATQTPFDPPGKSLQVLPIGLGIFGGISVIAIIIVGVVTYERTKHRRNFRNRKLAETGAAMGYGGVAQVA